MNIKSTVGNLTANPIGAIAGGLAFYLGAKKVAKVENKWAVIGLVAVGIVAGAIVQSKIKSRVVLKQTVTEKAKA